MRAEWRSRHSCFLFFDLYLAVPGFHGAFAASFAILLVNLDGMEPWHCRSEQLSSVQLSDKELSDKELSDIKLSDIKLSDIKLSDIKLSGI